MVDAERQTYSLTSLLARLSELENLLDEVRGVLYNVASAHPSSTYDKDKSDEPDNTPIPVPSELMARLDIKANDLFTDADHLLAVANGIYSWAN